MINEDGIDVCGGELHFYDECNDIEYYRCYSCDSMRMYEDFCGNEDYKKVIRNKKIDELLKDKL